MNTRNLKINLIDVNKELCNWWESDFKLDIEAGRVSVIHGPHYFTTPAIGYISPANSFGIMDGGIDKAIINHFGQELQRDVLCAVALRYFGEIPVGSAIDIAISGKFGKYLIVAPTMRQPEDISKTYNPYLAMRAILALALENNINPINVCGLGTGIGKVPPQRCSWLMYEAYEQIKGWNGKLPSFPKMWEQHKNLKEFLI